MRNKSSRWPTPFGGKTKDLSHKLDREIYLSATKLLQITFFLSLWNVNFQSLSLRFNCIGFLLCLVPFLPADENKIRAVKFFVQFLDKQCRQPAFVSYWQRPKKKNGISAATKIKANTRRRTAHPPPHSIDRPHQRSGAAKKKKN